MSEVIDYLVNTLEIAGVILQAFLVISLLRGSLRKYRILFLYAVATLVTTLLEVVVSQTSGRENHLFRTLYWSDEIALDLLLFLMVISLTFMAMEGNPLRAKAGRVLITIVAVVVILPFVVFQRPVSTNWNPWFASTSQLLSFGAAIMNLGLWTALLGSRRRDPQLLMVSAGLGVAVTGAAIAYGVRRFIPQTGARWIPNLLINATHVASMFLWCWAFRPVKRRQTLPAPVTSL